MTCAGLPTSVASRSPQPRAGGAFVVIEAVRAPIAPVGRAGGMRRWLAVGALLQAQEVTATAIASPAVKCVLEDFRYISRALMRCRTLGECGGLGYGYVVDVPAGVGDDAVGV